MAIVIPKTATEAAERGFTKVTEEEWQRFVSKHSAALGGAGPVNCSQVPVGTKCLEVPGDNGEIISIYCSANRSCTDRFRINP